MKCPKCQGDDTSYAHIDCLKQKIEELEAERDQAKADEAKTIAMLADVVKEKWELEVRLKEQEGYNGIVHDLETTKAKLKDAEETIVLMRDKAGSNTVMLGVPITPGGFADIYETAMAYLARHGR